jgi:predicted transglutaminase-like cysteine proteinase
MRFLAGIAAVIISIVATNDVARAEQVGLRPFALPGKALPLVFGRPTAIPRGYFALCRTGHSVCRVTHARGVPTTAAGVVALSEGLYRELAEINERVNHGIRPRADRPKDDGWTVGGAIGDCEDYALTKKRLLIRAGWPSSAALLALGNVRSGEDHAVLIVRTTWGALVLDNLSDEIRPWNVAKPRLRMVQSPIDTWRWHEL